MYHIKIIYAKRFDEILEKKKHNKKTNTKENEGKKKPFTWNRKVMIFF